MCQGEKQKTSIDAKGLAERPVPKISLITPPIPVEAPP